MRTRIDATENARKLRVGDTEDAPLIPYPKNNKEYIETINYLVDTYFTDVDCFKMIKMLDILHKTLREALLQKKNIKINSYVTSVLENKSLYNHLQNIENKNIPLYNVLFDRDGNGIIIWGTQSTVTTKRKEKNTLFLAQLVNPYNETERLQDIPTTKKGFRKN